MQQASSRLTITVVAGLLLVAGIVLVALGFNEPEPLGAAAFLTAGFVLAGLSLVTWAIRAALDWWQYERRQTAAVGTDPAFGPASHH